MWGPRMRGSLQADHDPPGPADHDRGEHVALGTVLGAYAVLSREMAPSFLGTTQHRSRWCCESRSTTRSWLPHDNVPALPTRKRGRS
jgi:hypothetical protein